MFSKQYSAFRFKPALSTTSFSFLSLPKHLKHQSTSVLCKEQKPINHGIHILSDHPNPEISAFPTKGFSEITSLATGRALHAICIKECINLSLFHSNTLINMYSKFENVHIAQALFDQMPQRNKASWNTMISGYVRVGFYAEAIGLFSEMRDQGINPNGYVIASLLTACSRSVSMVCQGFQIHGFVVKMGLLFDVFVSSALLHFYGTYSLTCNARMVFEEMPERNVVSWTSLMASYSNNGDPEEAVKIYIKMRHEGVSCNQNSLATVISACGLLEDELLGLQVLAHVIVSGFESNVSVSNSLISLFGSVFCMEDACYIFCQMKERDTISWNSMISSYSHNGFYEESLKCFDQMRHANVKPNSATFSSLLSASSCVDNLKWGMGIHGLVVKLGLELVVSISNTLINMYAESGKSQDAELLFQEMPERDLISWNSMIACYAEDGKYQDVLKLLAEISGTRKIANHVTFANALVACASHESLIYGKTLHAVIIRAGLHDNLLLGNALVTAYGNCRTMRTAKLVFKVMPKRDVVTWNALLGGYVETKEPGEAIKTINLMREDGTFADYITIVNVLGSCSTPDDLLKYGMPFHAHIILSGFERDDYVKNSLLTMYSKCGDLDSSNFIFGRLLNKSIVSWNVMIAANAHNGRGEEAVKLIVELRHAGMEFDQFSFSGGFAASASLATLEEGQQLHGLVIKLGFDSNLHVINAAMDMYAKCGEMDDVLKILPEPSSRSRMSWNILISGFARHGDFKKAREAFHEMVQLGPNPDHVTFVSLLSACSHGGLVDEGLAYYSLMSSEFGVLPGMEHCVCMVDLLGRSGRFDDAERFIKEMPVPPNDLVWRSLLASCRTHGNLELGKIAAKNLLKLDPSDDSAYVLLSNVCATSGMWEDVEDVRRTMKLNNIKKQPACSWTRLKNKVTSFGMGDQSHPQARQIYLKLKELKKIIKEAGYIPETNFALHDTDEEQKEHNLWNHSEKLALAFGLINTPENSTIRIFKNLRVCGDCHSFYKFVSAAVRRKIILRDPYRFHHFSGGKCSCTDYW
ncbi:PREDICTED: pentatricopeptide repeat-containing protein At3g24000, mitochondrial [Nelumbo nucifera]|uniref:DYW domain-containing protein n=2 Tax=Nelumbo nucifera TaxID=4432 RepID=A0A822ZKF9_NELNU|nr:PREDICTED: pentatricopeptide repeat-containing protein At3g24000, mitochondrial [Nelumbo nucifera]DAD46564.1 TPA_asm: hypothetical protein HUJ06_016501 [Nelumbo nucifera]